MGGNANCLKLQKIWPKEVKNVEIIVKSNHEELVKTQMRGALAYSKNKDKFIII
jgi:hypothetical protein